MINIDKNFFLSPISIQLLTHGRCSLTVSSIGTGGIFSPPAVIISSVNVPKTKHELQIYNAVVHPKENDSVDPIRLLLGSTVCTVCSDLSSPLLTIG